MSKTRINFYTRRGREGSSIIFFIPTIILYEAALPVASGKDEGDFRYYSGALSLHFLMFSVSFSFEFGRLGRHRKRSSDYARLRELLDQGKIVRGVSDGHVGYFYRDKKSRAYILGYGEIPGPTSWFLVSDKGMAKFNDYQEYFNDCCERRDLFFIDK